MKKRLQRLKYLSDKPLNHDENSPDEDFFNHEGYVEFLHKTIQECPDRFCIGLFGRWGSGKTGVINGLIKKIENDNSLKSLYFNVWKYSSDSLRRQLLLRIDCKFSAEVG